MKTNRTSYTMLAATLVLLGAGCKTVVRENIISSINTGIGVTVAQNPKTEMYEAKAGYIRSQFYSVPTGKVVENEDKNDGPTVTETNKGGENVKVTRGRKDVRSNRADITPQIVSGIRMKSGVKELFIGIDVSESFAVGESAVKSDAAIAMYIADAKDAANATNAAAAVSASAAANEKVRTQLEKDRSASRKLTLEAGSLISKIGAPAALKEAAELAVKHELMEESDAKQFDNADDKSLPAYRSLLREFATATDDESAANLKKFNEALKAKLNK